MAGFPGQRLSDEKKELEGQVIHKRNYGNKLLFLQFEDENQSEAIFSFEVYGEVRRVRKEISLGDIVRCVGTWRDCVRIMDVFSYSIEKTWAEMGGGAQFPTQQRKVVSGPAQQIEASTRRLCKFWMSNGTCMRSQCHDFHPEADALREAKIEWKAFQAERLAQNASPEDPHETKKGHAHRAAVFADWLSETFGALLLKGVLDIAGGRGDLAFELSVKRGIPCTVLDPRTGAWQMTRSQKLWLRSKGVPASESADYVARSPLKQRQGTVENALQALKEQDETWNDVFDCGVLVGLHPDQATGGILQLAQALHRPWAVVPCCTFADLFPERLVKGRPVRTYDDLVEWLMSFGAQKDFLMFFGKNLVVYQASET